MNPVSSLRFRTWFRDDEVPHLIGDSTVILGGNCLLRTFFTAVLQETAGGKLSIAVPYIGKFTGNEICNWSFLNHRALDVRLVLRGRGDARYAVDELSLYPWRSLLVARAPRLHAKIYAFEPSRGGGIALVGSHNLSLNGSRENSEAGVLIVSKSNDHIGEGISLLDEHISRIIRTSTSLFDSTLSILSVVKKRGSL